MCQLLHGCDCGTPFSASTLSNVVTWQNHSFVRQLARLIPAFAEMCLAQCGCLLSEDLLSVVTDYFVIATAELILQ